MTQTVLDLTELVDLDGEPRCEHSQHDRLAWVHAGPAAYAIRSHHEGCSGSAMLLLCAAAWAANAGRMIRCIYCDTRHDRDSIWRIVEVL